MPEWGFGNAQRAFGNRDLATHGDVAKGNACLEFGNRSETSCWWLPVLTGFAVAKTLPISEKVGGRVIWQQKRDYDFS
jgi:hypothetical protein